MFNIRSFIGYVGLTWLSLVSAHGQALQDSIPEKSPAATYKFSVGGRLVTIGDSELSLSGRYFKNPKTAFRFVAGRADWGDIITSLTIERYRQFNKPANFRYFYGAGLAATFPAVQNEAGTRHARLYLSTLVGLEYTPKSFPLSLGVDYRVMLRGGFQAYYIGSLGFSAHYSLGRQ